MENSHIAEMNISAIVLAAGYSSRMAEVGFKPVLPIGDGTVISNLLDSIECAGIDDIIVVTGHNAQAVEQVAEKWSGKVRTVHNPVYDEGMFTSIKAGVAALPEGCDGFLILPVDYPLVEKEVIERVVLAAMACAGEEILKEDYIVPCFRGKKGHPLYMPISYKKAILSHGGEGGLKAITDRDLSKLRRVETGRESCVMDMDTPSDYEMVKKFLAGGRVSRDGALLQSLAAGHRFVLARHGKIQQHEGKIFLGQTDCTLSARGEEQAKQLGTKLAELLKETDASCIYSSPLVRAYKTAERVSERLGLSIKSEEDFMEMSLGKWDGMLIDDVKEKWPKEYAARGLDIFGFKVGNHSESFYDLQYRVICQLIEILQEDSSRDIIIVSHSGVLRCIENNLFGKGVEDSWGKLETGEFRILEF